MIDKALLQKSAAPFGVALDDAALSRFDLYAQLLVETNAHMNLTAITQPDEIVEKHFADSLSVCSMLPLNPGTKLIDVGTGAGFPGLALLAAKPDLQVTLLDSTAKKLRFLAQTAQEMGLTPTTLHARAEEAGQDPAYREQFDVVTARAVADLVHLSEYCLPFVKVGGYFLAMKSAKAQEELADAKEALALLGGQVEATKTFSLGESGERTLLLIKKISHTPTKYPRPSAQIAKKPLVNRH